MTRYLKKEDAPEWDYHIWTELLEARGDMLPYTPVAKVPLSGNVGAEKPVLKPVVLKKKG